MKAMRMKGQMVFEFVIAALILFTIVVYVINFLASAMGAYHSRFSGSFLESKAIQISEVLMNDPVEGLSYEWPQLDAEKMADFDAGCQDVDSYIALIGDFGLVENEPFEIYHHMSIMVNSTDGTSYVDCGRTPPEMMTRSVVTRFGVLPSGGLATIQVMVW